VSDGVSASIADHQNRRRHHRFPMVASVRIYSGSAMWTTSLIDVSLRGVMVTRPTDWIGRPESLFRLDLRLENGPIIAMGVKLVRCGDADLAFACHKVDLGSFTELKRMIELNLGNTEALNRELSMLGQP
jgi:hypothetical protein